jgi:glycerol kinase
LYQNDPHIKKAIDTGGAYFGTIETWLLYKLTDGKSYFTNHTNASRTLFFNINTLSWDRSLLKLFNLKNLKLPEVTPSSFMFGESNFNGIFNHKLTISAAIGDSHAAAFGQTCFEPGMAKATLGTGCSILLNTGKKRITSREGMMTTICFSLKDTVYYALEGIIVTCGATMQWLKNQLGLIDEINNAEQLVLSVKDNNSVYFLPAFSGLGAPHWKMDTKAMITGITFGCNKNHIIRAALESIPFQIKDVIQSMEEDSKMPLKKLNVDGGITSNSFVMQFLADLLDADVEIITGIKEVSALGAAYLAGLESGIFPDLNHIGTLNKNKDQFIPGVENKIIKYYYEAWQKAIKTML